MFLLNCIVSAGFSAIIRTSESEESYIVIDYEKIDRRFNEARARIAAITDRKIAIARVFNRITADKARSTLDIEPLSPALSEITPSCSFHFSEFSSFSPFRLQELVIDIDGLKHAWVSNTEPGYAAQIDNNVILYVKESSAAFIVKDARFGPSNPHWPGRKPLPGVIGVFIRHPDQP